MFPEGLGNRLHQVAEVGSMARQVPTELEFTKRAREKWGFSSATLTQCNSIASWLKHLWQLHLDPNEDFQVHLMTIENAIAGVVAGAYLGAGDHSLAIFQNSGLSNFGDGVVSFGENYGIPILAISTFRGLGEVSLPHQSWARRTIGMSRLLMGGKHVYGSILGRNIEDSFDRACEAVLNQDNPSQAIVLLPKWAIKESLPKTPPNKADTDYKPQNPEVRAARGTNLEDYAEREKMSLKEALQEIDERHKKALVISCNGNTSRELLFVKDRPNHFYNAGYMGGGKAIGYGAAISNPNLEVVVIDGDQNAQMGFYMYDVLDEYYPPNLHIYTLNDGGASSVDASVPSRRLSRWHYEMTHVIRTAVQEVSEHSRVEEGINKLVAMYSPADAEILKRELGELKYITRRVIRWRQQEGKDPIKVPAVYKGVLT